GSRLTVECHLGMVERSNNDAKSVPHLMRSRTDKAPRSDVAGVRTCREQERRPNVTREAPPGGEIALGAQVGNEKSSTKAARPWLMVQQWITANTFAPRWLPRRWQHPLVGYLLAVLAELLA